MHTYTEECVRWWAQSRKDRHPEWIANYQKSLQVRHRSAIVAQVKALGATTVLELGCHCGPNLIRLAQEDPAILLHGCDVNEDAIVAGRSWAQSLGVASRITLGVGAFPAYTDSFPTGCADVVLTCYSLAYIERADLDATIYEIGRLAKRAVILAEPMCEGASVSARMSNGYQEWAHDYEDATRWVGSWAGMTQTRVPVSPPVDRLNTILVAVRA